MTELHWLPDMPDWRARLKGLASSPDTVWENAVALAGARINFVLTNALDESLRRLLSSPPDGIATKPVRLAVLGSSTLTHLLPAIRVAGLRRGDELPTAKLPRRAQQQSSHGKRLQDGSAKRRIRSTGPI